MVFEDGEGLPDVVADVDTEEGVPRTSPSTSLRMVAEIGVLEIIGD